VHHALEAGPFAAELLGAAGIVPDFGLLQLAFDLDQAVALARIVKGTPSGLRGALAGP